jgi:predicted hydrolase (HD superfamily)
MLSRDEAIELVKKYLKDINLRKNSIIAEALLRQVAKILGKDEELWGLTGLLHNLDYDYTRENPEKRGILSANLLENLLPEKSINAIKANNYMHTDYIPVTSLDKSLISISELTGFVITVAQSTPSKHLSDVDLNTLLNKFNDQNFATRFNRNKIKLCEDVGIDLENFFNLTLNTLKQISNQLGI